MTGMFQDAQLCCSVSRISSPRENNLATLFCGQFPWCKCVSMAGFKEWTGRGERPSAIAGWKTSLRDQWLIDRIQYTSTDKYKKHKFSFLLSWPNSSRRKTLTKTKRGVDFHGARKSAAQLKREPHQASSPPTSLERVYKYFKGNQDLSSILLCNGEKSGAGKSGVIWIVFKFKLLLPMDGNFPCHQAEILSNHLPRKYNYFF